MRSIERYNQKAMNMVKVLDWMGMETCFRHILVSLTLNCGFLRGDKIFWSVKIK